MNIIHTLKSNIMRKIFIVAFTTLFIITVNAQEAAFEWSELITNSTEGLQNPNMVFPEESGFVTYSIEKQGTQYYTPESIFITKFSSNFKKESTISADLPKLSEKDATFLKVLEGNNKLYFFSHVATKKAGKHNLYVQVYDNERNVISDAKELYSLNIEKVNNSGFFEVSMSSNTQIISVLVNMPYQKKTNEIIEIVNLDENLNEQFKKSFTLSFESERAYHENLFIQNDGTVIIIKKTDLGKKDPNTSILKIKDNDLTENQLSGDDFYISDSQVVTINKLHYLVGFATDNAKPTVSIGGYKDTSFFIYNISDNKLVKNQKWSKETTKRLLGKGFINLEVKDALIVGEDILLIGDCYSQDSEAIEGKNFEYNYTHRFGSGVVIKCNTQGEVTYEIPLVYFDDYKNEMSRLGSFYAFLKNNEFNILANEKESVLKKKKIVTGYDKINAKAPVLRTIEGNEIITNPFWNSKVGGKDDVTYFAPSKTIRISNNTFYIYSYGNKYQQFGKMTLN